MRRPFHCPTRAVLSFAGALLFSQPALAAESKGRTAHEAGAVQRGEHEKPGAAKSKTPPHAGNTVPAGKSGAKGSSKPGKPAPSAKATVSKSPTPAKHATASTSKPSAKQALVAKPPLDSKHPLRPAPSAAAAKSLVPTRGDERTRALEAEPHASVAKPAALSPPGAGRPMVRQVSSRLVIPPRDVAERTLAFHYANLGDAEVIAELNRRGIAWVPASPPLPGVRTPIRLAGPLHGVTIHSTLPEPERRSSAFEILDARLALALDDFCALLARHDVVEIVHYTMYRPPAELPPDLNKQIRHPAGLAIDVGAVRKADGRWLAVGPHWPSDIGAKTCGEGAREYWSRPGREIVSIACEAADLRMFHFILTPHFDAAHADHLHLEIKPDTRWFLVN
jgi:hypothetical protein